MLRYLTILARSKTSHVKEGRREALLIKEDLAAPADTPEEARARRLLEQLSWCGHYMHFHGGGRSGKAPILCLLAKHGGQMTQQELGMRFDLRPGSLSEVLSKLEAGGLIVRARSERDRRVLTVSLTDEGRARAAEDQAARTVFRARAFANLTPDEQEQLVGMLDKIKTCWEELDD